MNNSFWKDCEYPQEYGMQNAFEYLRHGLDQNDETELEQDNRMRLAGVGYAEKDTVRRRFTGVDIFFLHLYHELNLAVQLQAP